MQDLASNPPSETLSKPTANASAGGESPCRAVRYDPARHEAMWDRFVKTSMNGTVFHRQKFLRYHPEGRFDFHHLMFFRGEKLVAVLPGRLINNGKVYDSPAGASYGSFVTEDI